MQAKDATNMVPRGAVECAMHMTDGLVTHMNAKAAVAKWQDHSGFDSLLLELIPYAELAEKYYEGGIQKYKDCPGVYDYEVSCPFGAWFCEQVLERGTAPTRITAEAKLRSLAYAFWSQFNKVEEKPKHFTYYVVSYVSFGGVGGFDWYCDKKTSFLKLAIALEEVSIENVFYFPYTTSLSLSDKDGITAEIDEKLSALEDEAELKVHRKKPAPCPACQGRKFILADIDGTGHYAIQRCDSCSPELTDSDLNKAVYELACNASDSGMFDR